MKHRVVGSLLLISLLLCCPLRMQAAYCGMPLFGKVVAIDPGHGGPDPGATRGTLLEKDIVLDLGFKLRELLGSTGAVTFMTRESDVDLADQSPALTGGRKRRDILRRVELINQWQPDAALSLHVNAINSSRWRGAQVFYPPNDPESERLAETIQSALTRVLKNTNRVAKVGDYRVLNDSQCPVVLVEVGFISNPEEAALLQDENYQQKIVWAIYLGLQEWLAQTEEE